MRDPNIDDVVKLTRDVPHMNLCKGQIGVVRSLWKAATVAYEVEFVGLDEKTRAVLLRDQLTVDGEEEETARDGRGQDESFMSNANF